MPKRAEMLAELLDSHMFGRLDAEEAAKRLAHWTPIYDGMTAEGLEFRWTTMSCTNPRADRLAARLRDLTTLMDTRLRIIGGIQDNGVAFVEVYAVKPVDDAALRALLEEQGIEFFALPAGVFSIMTS